MDQRNVYSAITVHKDDDGLNEAYMVIVNGITATTHADAVRAALLKAMPSLSPAVIEEGIIPPSFNPGSDLIIHQQAFVMPNRYVDFEEGECQRTIHVTTYRGIERLTGPRFVRPYTTDPNRDKPS